MYRPAAMVLGIAFAVMIAATSDADDDDIDFDRAYRAVQQGEALPLATVLDRVSDDLPGDVIGVELEEEHGTLVYEFLVLGGDGRVWEVYVDAATAEILVIEQD